MPYPNKADFVYWPHHSPSADRRRLAEHLGLQLTGLIPCWLPTHRGVEGKNQPPTLSYFGERFDLAEKTIKLSAGGDGRSRAGMIALGLGWERRFLGPVLAHCDSANLGLLRWSSPARDAQWLSQVLLLQILRGPI